MKLTLVQIQEICLESIEMGFASKLYQSYDSILAYAAMQTLAYVAANGRNMSEEDTFADVFDEIDFALMPENFEVLERFFNRAEEAKLKEFFSLRTSINEISNFDDSSFEETMKQLAELKASESEVLGALKAIV